MRRMLLVLLLAFAIDAPVFAESAVYQVANARQEDAYASWGSTDANGFTNGHGWQFFGFDAGSGCYYAAYWRWALNIPKGSIITRAEVQLRADYTNAGSFDAAFTALKPDGRWENSNGFSNTNYPNGTNLRNIPRQGEPAPWNNLSNWNMGEWHTSPDLSVLVQARIDNTDYDPGHEWGKYFGLALDYVAGTGFLTATQEPDIDTYTARLYVEWVTGPPLPPSNEAGEVFTVGNNVIEDAFATRGAQDLNGYNQSSGWHYFGYASSTACWYNAYWRWALSVPRGSQITGAWVKIRSDYTNAGYLTAAFKALSPDGKWEGEGGFNAGNYPKGSSLNGIPRQGDPVLWNDLPGWTGNTWFYSPDLSQLVQARVDDPDYNPDDPAGRYFGLVLFHVAGAYYRTGTQEPDDDTFTTRLYVRWIPPPYCPPDAVEICGDEIDNNCNGEIDEYCNACPSANAGPDGTARVGETAPLNGSASADSDGNMLTYRWTVVTKPASSVAEISDPAAITPEIEIDCPGEYVIELVVSDGICESEPDPIVITTVNSCPSADAGPDQSVFVGNTVYLDGGLSRDDDGDWLDFSWSLVRKPAGSVAEVAPANAQTGVCVIDKAGEYHVELRVSDRLCQSEPDTVVISTLNVAPVADAGPDQETLAGMMAQLDGSASYDPDGDALSHFWTIISAPVFANYFQNATVLSNPTSAAPSFTPEFGGQYVVQLIVSDGVIESEPDTCLINVVVPEYACPRGQGYWANHQWPVESLMLGKVVYQNNALLTLLKMPVRGDASLILARQLTAAKLNILNGADPAPIGNSVLEADALLFQSQGELPYGIKTSSAAGKKTLELAQALEEYNQGLLTPDCVN